MGTIIIAGQEVPVVRLDELPIIDPASGNSAPVIADGAAAQSSLTVILGLITKAHLAGKLLAEDIPFDPDAADILTMLTAQGAIDELATMVINRLRVDADQGLNPTQQEQGRDNLALGTAALKNTGTSGDAVPLLNGSSTWTGTHSYSGSSPTINFIDTDVANLRHSISSFSNELTLRGDVFDASPTGGVRIYYGSANYIARFSATGLAMQADKGISFSGTGAATTRTNLGLGYAQRGSPIVFTVGGTYTPTAGCRAAIIEVQGAGGSGAASSNSGGTASCGSGGAAGGYAVRFLDTVVSATITVGAGGTAPSAGANNGNAGGSSSFADGTVTVTANGGDGGVNLSTTSAAVLASAVALGGTASGGNINIRGDYSGQGIVAGGATAFGGGGASSRFGVGGNAQLASGTGNTNTGTAGSGFGSGSGSARNGSAGAGAAGVAGQNGVVIITELF